MLIWLCVVFVFSTHDLLFLKLNSISPSALWRISKILYLGSLPLQRWQGVAWSLSSAPPANPLRATGLCCLLRYLWPKERSPCTIKKVERSGLPKGKVSEFQCAHTKSYLQTWLWITEENAGVCRWIQTIFLPGKSIVLWAGCVSFTLAFLSLNIKSLQWNGNPCYCTIFEEPTGPTPVTFHIKKHRLHLMNSTPQHTLLTSPCLRKAWDLNPAVSFSGRNIEHTDIWAWFLHLYSKPNSRSGNLKLYFLGFLFIHIFISELKICISLWTCPGVH